MVGAVHRVHANHFPRLYCKTATIQDPNPPGKDLTRLLKLWRSILAEGISPRPHPGVVLLYRVMGRVKEGGCSFKAAVIGQEDEKGAGIRTGNTAQEEQPQRAPLSH